MRRTEYEYLVVVHAETTKAEVDSLVDLASHHYDYACKEYAATGRLRGFLNELGESAEPSDAITVQLRTRDLQVIGKILESPHAPLALRETVSDLIREASAEYSRRNGGPDEDLEEALRLLSRADSCPTPGRCTCRSEVAAFVQRVRKERPVRG